MFKTFVAGVILIFSPIIFMLVYLLISKVKQWFIFREFLNDASGINDDPGY